MTTRAYAIAVLGLLSGLMTVPAWATSSPLADKLSRQPGVSCQPGSGGDICTIKPNNPGFHYSQPIGILIPTGVEQPAELVLYFHGFRGVCGDGPNASAAEIANGFDMLAQMRAPGAKNSVTIFPVSQGHENNFNSELVPRLDDFTIFIAKLVQPMPNNHWVISGHSGAYQPIGNALAVATQEFLKRLDSVILLDATYTSRPGWFQSFRNAAAVNPKMDVYTVYRDGGGTGAASAALKAQLPGNHVEVIRSRTPQHCRVPNEYFGLLLEKTIARHASPSPQPPISPIAPPMPPRAAPAHAM